MTLAAIEKGLHGLRVVVQVAKFMVTAACVAIATVVVVGFVVWTYASPEEKSRYRDAFWAIERVLFPQKPSVVPLSQKELDELLKRSMWPRHLHAQVRRVVECESARRPNALRDNGSRGLDVGLMQVNNRAHRQLLSLIGSEAKLLDPLANLNVGHLVFSQAGRSWKPWRSSQACHGLLLDEEQQPKGKGRKAPERLAARE